MKGGESDVGGAFNSYMCMFRFLVGREEKGRRNIMHTEIGRFDSLSRNE